MNASIAWIFPSTILNSSAKRRLRTLRRFAANSADWPSGVEVSSLVEDVIGRKQALGVGCLDHAPVTESRRVESPFTRPAGIGLGEAHDGSDVAALRRDALDSGHITRNQVRA